MAAICDGVLSHYFVVGPTIPATLLYLFWRRKRGAAHCDFRIAATALMVAVVATTIGLYPIGVDSSRLLHLTGRVVWNAGVLLIVVGGCLWLWRTSLHYATRRVRRARRLAAVAMLDAARLAESLAAEKVTLRRRLGAAEADAIRRVHVRFREDLLALAESIRVLGDTAPETTTRGHQHALRQAQRLLQELLLDPALRGGSYSHPPAPHAVVSVRDLADSAVSALATFGHGDTNVLLNLEPGLTISGDPHALLLAFVDLLGALVEGAPVGTALTVSCRLGHAPSEVRAAWRSRLAVIWTLESTAERLPPPPSLETLLGAGASRWRAAAATVTAHDGDLEVVPRADGGTIVRLYFPALEDTPLVAPAAMGRSWAAIILRDPTMSWMTQEALVAQGISSDQVFACTPCAAGGALDVPTGHGPPMLLVVEADLGPTALATFRAQWPHVTTLPMVLTVGGAMPAGHLPSGVRWAVLPSSFVEEDLQETLEMLLAPRQAARPAA